MLYTDECMRDKRISANTYPQIIDKLTFEQVQKRLIKSKILANANSAVERYIMSAGGGTGQTRQKHMCVTASKKMVDTNKTHLNTPSQMLKGTTSDMEYQNYSLTTLFTKCLRTATIL